MLVAMVLIKADTGQEKRVLDEVLKIEGVTDGHLLLGMYDISVKVKAEGQEHLSKIVSSDIRKVPGVTETRTLPTVSFGTID